MSYANRDSRCHGRSERLATISTLEEQDYRTLMGGDETLSVTSDRDGALEQLKEICHEASVPDWDGLGSSRADVDAYVQSIQFIRALPPAIPDPDIDVTPEGKFIFSWQREVGHLLTLTIGPLGEIAYAGRYGHVRSSGDSLFVDFVPRHVLQELDHLFS